MRTCKYCGGEVSDTAKKCKHCGEWLINKETETSSKNNTVENKTVKSETNNDKILTNEETNTPINPQQNAIKKQELIIICVSCVVAIIIALVVGFLFPNIVNNQKGNEIEKIIKNANEKVFDYESAGIENTIYKLMENDYNQIVYFKDKNTGADTYAFRVNTDLEIGNSGIDFFNYEIGRIIINPKNNKNSKCSYNFRTKLDNKEESWTKCSEKSFVDSLPKIAKLKKREYEKYKKLVNLEKQAEICSYYGSENYSECQNPEIDTAYERAEEQLAKLRSTTL